MALRRRQRAGRAAAPDPVEQDVMVRARVKPELIRWVREDAGLSVAEAATKTGTTETVVRQWERGERQATIRQLRLLGNAAGRPLAVFYLAEPPRKFSALKDFRRLPGEAAAAPSRALRLAVRTALERQQVAVHLARDLGELPASLPARASSEEPVVNVARRVRGHLGISLAEQRGWSGPYPALNAWRRAVQEQGVLVFQASGVPIAEMRGFSTAKPPMPMIVLNVGDAPYGRVFTLLHEYCHLLLRNGGVCDLQDPPGRPEHDPVEVFCNAVAGEALVPGNALGQSTTITRHAAAAAWSDSELRRLAREFSVSRDVVLRRLLDTGRLTVADYRAHRAKARQESAPRQGGFALPATAAVSRLGRAFVRLVLRSYYQERITTRDVASHLGVRLKHVGKIEEMVMGSALMFG